MTIDSAAQKAIANIAEGKRPGYTEIAKELGVSPERIRSKVRWMMKDKHKEAGPLQYGGDDLTYQIVDRYYTWETIYGPVKIPIEDVDEMFFQYSRHGMDKSSTQMMQDWGLEPWQWHSLKSRLRLYKDAHIFSPYTVQITPSAEMEQMIERKMIQLYEKTHVMVEKSYNRITLREARKVIFESQKKEVISNQVIEALESHIPNMEIVPLKPLNKTSGDIERLYVAISDLHIGLRDTDELIKDRLSQVLEIIHSKNPKSVTILFMGDLIESFTGTNKNDTWQNLSMYGYGSKVVMQTVETLVSFLMPLVPFDLECYCVPGNHDRMTSSKKDDPIGQIGLLIYGICDRMLPSVSFVIKEDVHSLLMDPGIEIIMMHGDKGMSKIAPSEIREIYSTGASYSVILRGHYHHRQIIADTSTCRYLTVPSIIDETPYSRSIGAHNTAGVIMLYTDAKKRLITLDYTLI
jgi:predicted phosphodiesterase